MKIAATLLTLLVLSSPTAPAQDSTHLNLPEGAIARLGKGRFPEIQYLPDGTRLIDGQMQLDAIGKIVVECWSRIPQHFFSAELDVYVVMPNHIHGIILLGTGEAKCPCLPPRSQPNRRGEVSSPPSPNRRSKISSPTLG